MSIEYITIAVQKYNRLTAEEIYGETTTIECARIFIPPATVRACQEIAAKKTLGIWQQPPSELREGAYKDNIFVGFLGEAAFGFYSGLPPNREVLPGGDGGIDFTFMEKTFNIKTGRSKDWHRNFIDRIHDRKPKKPLKSDFYIGAYIENYDTVLSGPCHIILVGYISRRILNAQDLVKSPHFSNLLNTEMYFCDLFPIRGLLQHYEHYLQQHPGA